MNDGNDWGSGFIKIAITWMLAFISDVTAQQVLTYLGIAFTAVQLYTLLRKEMSKSKKDVK